MNRVLSDVSVVVPVFNKPLWQIQRAIISALRQHTTYTREIIIFDDGSFEPDGRRVQELVERMATQSHAGIDISFHGSPDQQGAAVARNNAIRKARGEYVMLLDADDELHPDAIKKLREQMHAGIDLVFSDHEVVKSNGDRWVRRKASYHYFHERYWGSPYDPLIQSTYVVQCQLIRVSAFFEVGGYPDNIRVGEHAWLLCKLAYRSSPGNIAHIPGAFYRHYWYPDGTYRRNIVSHRQSVSAAFHKTAKELGIDVSAVEFIARFKPYRVSHYRLIRKDGLSFKSPYLDYRNLIFLHNTTI